MKPLVIFGTSQIAELAHFYFTRDADRSVVAFTVDGAYVTEATNCSCPVVPFEELAERFPADEHDVFVALSYASINKLREHKFNAVQALGYDCPSYISSRATVLTQYPIGKNCFILEDNTIQPFVRIGHNVTLWSGNHIGHHSVIEDHAFISSHVVVSGNCYIEEGCFLGVNSTIRDNMRIGKRSVLGVGARILEDVAPEGVYMEKSTERSRVPSSRLRGL
ncbi:sugar O-acyltransferase, sialic acid O-acetyltransferase NeuD family [Jannaschia faecimaris]|uniref:Sugar O-acyltransferase, sialic acid O-acetyltransferase NeuD family n=1 Tax=Jannaschia faecimaris TaxID=1244108 RepID=A0A1H3JPD1_9RHOB|nr:acetyltransferase [Jannaschia faecimaris]SDY41793.1 sugar O-acyltransferase, sialic acid O-acetyltransferase NeuD family [Jannaschia faecimaris]